MMIEFRNNLDKHVTTKSTIHLRMVVLGVTLKPIIISFALKS